MINRWSLVAVLLGVLAGYSLSGRSVQAQTDALPFAVGDTVTLWYGTESAAPAFGTSVECVVAEFRGGYVRCGRNSRIGGSSDRTARWLSTKYVVAVTKQE